MIVSYQTFCWVWSLEKDVGLIMVLGFLEGKKYPSPSSFAVAALRSAGAKNRTTANGWQIVMHKNK